MILLQIGLNVLLAKEVENRIGDIQVKFILERESGYTNFCILVSSKGTILSKDINSHFEYIFKKLESEYVLLDYSSFKCFFDVKWESTYLYAGDGPILSPMTINKISKYNAGIVFDIYDISEDE